MKKIDETPKDKFLRLKAFLSEHGRFTPSNYDNMTRIKTQDKIPEGITEMLMNVAKIFTYVVNDKRPDLHKFMPYEIHVIELEIKNEWTESATFIAVNQEDGKLELRLNYQKVIDAMNEDMDNVEARFLWLFLHEFRHKVQNGSSLIKSVIDYGNWDKFNEFMQKEYNQDKDKIDHVFHEMNPAEVDAHIFACELSGIPFKGTVFDITDEKLNLLKS